MGANKENIEKEIPHISSLMCSSLEEVLEFSEVLVIGNKNDDFKDILKKAKTGQKIIDFVRITEEENGVGDGYEGICW